MTSRIGKYHRAGYLLTSVLMLTLISGCAGRMQTTPDTFPRLIDSPSIVVDDTDVLSLSSEMKQFVDRYVQGPRHSEQRLRSLVQAVIHPGMLGFEYDGGITLTAQQAFRSGRGNCLAFSNMFVAMARYAGLKAHFQEAEIVPEWNQQNDAFILAKHINVLVQLRDGDFVVDVGNSRAGKKANATLRPDRYAKAQYFNNLGVEELFAGNIPRAYAHFRRAVTIEPTSEYLWSNLGVAYNRNKQTEAAIWAYQQAMKVDRGALAAMSNLSSIYFQRGDFENADKMRGRVERYRANNPYYLLMLSDRAISEQRYQDAISLLRKAIKKKETEHLLHFALAKSFYLSGHYDQAENSFQRAKQLAPGAILRKTYNKNLDELVQSEI